jgi:hypothetical protein
VRDVLAYGRSNRPSLAVLSGVISGPAVAASKGCSARGRFRSPPLIRPAATAPFCGTSARSIQRGVGASPALWIESASGRPSLSIAARKRATPAGR